MDNQANMPGHLQLKWSCFVCWAGGELRATLSDLLPFDTFFMHCALLRAQKMLPPRLHASMRKKTQTKHTITKHGECKVSPKKTFALMCIAMLSTSGSQIAILSIGEFGQLDDTYFHISPGEKKENKTTTCKLPKVEFS